MMTLARSDQSVLGRWWWTVDRWQIVALFLLMGMGAIFMLAASPAAADRIGMADPFQLARRHMVMIPLAVLLMLAISMLAPRSVNRFAVLGLLAAIALLIATLFIGQEIKGASRWIELGGFSLQPSEFAKPFFAVTAAWMFSLGRVEGALPGATIATGLYLCIAGLFLLQPDVGQTVVLTAVFGMQFFLAGLSLLWVGGIALCAIGLLVATYFLFPHVAERVDSFLDPSAGDTYQVERSLEAFQNGGAWGRGPGEGTVKDLLPDSHSDFIFAVAGEEFGVVVCLFLVVLFAFVVLRGFAKLMGETSLFVLLAATGLLTQVGLQAFINMASALHLIPTKGMTLPFISYGGSSYLALAIAMGMVLALTRRRPAGAEAL
ncbi:MAG TPA: putative peptidoglycan glycosyltransferase FtsW [Kiloniellales bacterium]|nr:putative peptidoglycan glycosyltransferase FtsW [Kiloniellales bacterium]